MELEFIQYCLLYLLMDRFQTILIQSNPIKINSNHSNLISYSPHSHRQKKFNEYRLSDNRLCHSDLSSIFRDSILTCTIQYKITIKVLTASLLVFVCNTHISTEFSCFTSIYSFIFFLFILLLLLLFVCAHISFRFVLFLFSFLHTCINDNNNNNNTAESRCSASYDTNVLTK